MSLFKLPLRFLFKRPSNPKIKVPVDESFAKIKLMLCQVNKLKDYGLITETEVKAILDKWLIKDL